MKYRKRATPVARAVERYLGGLDVDLPFRLVRLWRNWDRVVGEEVASLGRPLGHRDRVLVIGAEDHAAQQELVYWGPMILAVVHEFLGEECFDKVQADLLMGKTPLDAAGADALPGGVVSASEGERRPLHLGGLLGRMRPDSPVSRCYEAYVRRFGAPGPSDDDT